MPLANGDILRIAVRWRSSTAGDIVNVWDALVGDVTGALPLADVLAGVEDWVKELYLASGHMASVPNIITHQDIAVFNKTQNSPYGYTGAFSSLNGGGSGESPPAAVSCLLLFRTAVSRVVGRKYLPPMQNGSILDGLWDNAFPTAAALMAATAMSPYDTGEGFSLRYVVDRAAPASYALPVSYVARLTPAYQRRRKPGVGS